jgi:hypothetical protein
MPAAMSESRKITMSMVVDGKAFGLSYILTDAGRSTSKRSKQKNDCTVRALATARRIDYDTAYDLLVQAGRKCGSGFKFADFIKKEQWALKISFPAVKGQGRMNVAKFVEDHKEGTFICKVSKHVFTVIDGVVFDETDIAPDRCVYTAWRINK